MFLDMLFYPHHFFFVSFPPLFHLVYFCSIQHWEDYSDAIAKTIEEAFLGKEEKVTLDSERFVSFTKMRQIRLDNEKRYRNIRREVVTEISDSSKGDETEEDEDEKDEKKAEDEEEGEEVEVNSFVYFCALIFVP